MNLLAMMTLAVLASGADADTENPDTWVRVTSNHVEIVATPEDAEAVRKKSGAGILVQCKSLKINYTAEGKVIECEDCTFYTSTGTCGKAHSAVFDLVKKSLTLTGDETTPVEWTIEKNEDGEQKIFSQSMQITIPTAKRRPQRDDTRMFDEPIPDPFARRQATPQKPPVDTAPDIDDFPQVEIPVLEPLAPVAPVRTEPQLN